MICSQAYFLDAEEQSEDLKTILIDHAARYPEMEPTDAVKLIYQNEFGGGHLITDTESCMRYLRSEYASVVNNSSMPLFECIGNGIVRVNLSAVAREDLEELGNLFIRSAGKCKGSLQVFLEKLNVLRAVTAQGVFSFDLQKLESYLRDYEQAGYPAVSHSDAYRRAYRPAYRVVKRDLLEDLCESE